MTKRLFIDAGSLAEKNMSGVGHTTLNIIEALLKQESFCREYKIILIVPFNKVDIVKAHKPLKTVIVKKLFIPGKIMNGLVRFGMLPFMDLFFGRGTYLFPNFKNWPLMMSHSITYIHDVYFKIAPQHIESRNLDLLERHLANFIRRTDVVVTVSNHAKGEIERFFPESVGKVEVVYNGLDHSLYYPRKKAEQKNAAQKYGLTAKNYFVFFSNIEPRKNVDTLLDAYKIFIDRQGDKSVALLLVGGMGWGNKKTLDKISKLQRDGYKVIKPSSYVPDSDMPALLSGSISLVHPAVYEGFGLTPLEAMACNVPVIVGNNSSLPEVMGSSFSRYVDILNPEQIAKEMLYYYQGSATNIEGLRRSKQFTWRASANELSSIISKVSSS